MDSPRSKNRSGWNSEDTEKSKTPIFCHKTIFLIGAEFEFSQADARALEYPHIVGSAEDQSVTVLLCQFLSLRFFLRGFYLQDGFYLYKPIKKKLHSMYI